MSKAGASKVHLLLSRLLDTATNYSNIIQKVTPMVSQPLQPQKYCHQSKVPNKNLRMTTYANLKKKTAPSGQCCFLPRGPLPEALACISLSLACSSFSLALKARSSYENDIKKKHKEVVSIVLILLLSLLMASFSGVGRDKEMFSFPANASTREKDMSLLPRQVR